MNIILFSLRGLGDAMIMVERLNEYHEQFSEHNLTIVTWPKNKFIFSNLLTRCELYYVSAPYANKYISIFTSYIQIVKIVQGKFYDIAINFSGDFQENIYLSIVNSKKKISPLWCRQHKFNKLIKHTVVMHPHNIFIPKNIINVYDVYNYIFKVALNFNEKYKKINYLFDHKKAIGLFPFSSQSCRDWPLKNWDALAERLLLAGYNVYYICADDDAYLISDFYSLDQGARLYSSVSSDVFQLSEFIDFAVCLDSFSSHLLYFLKIPSIIIFGANHPSLFSTKGSHIISVDGGCLYYPCYNRPVCRVTKFKYACLTHITINMVESKVKEVYFK